MQRPPLRALLHRSVGTAVDAVLPEVRRPSADGIRGLLRRLGFWAAVSLPLVHVPLLLSGLDSTGDAVAFSVLFGANVLALLLGQGHDPG